VLTIGFLAPVLLGGCAGAIRSVHGFYTEKDVTYDPGLIGRWKPVRPEPKKVQGNKYELEIPESVEPLWEGSEVDFEPVAEQSSPTSKFASEGYKLTLHVPSSKHLTLEFKAHMFRLGDAQFLDEYFDTVRSKRQPLSIRIFAIPTHILEKIERRGDTVYLYPLSYEWFRKRFVSETLDFAHSEDEDGGLFLTGDTASLQEFVVKHTGDPEVFGPEAALQRRKGSK
jgi:hypothetical protein